MNETVTKHFCCVVAVLLGFVAARLLFLGPITPTQPIIVTQPVVSQPVEQEVLGASSPEDFTNFTALHTTGDLTVSGTAQFADAITISGTTSLATATVGNFFQGNYVNSITTSGATYTLSAADVCNSSEIQFTPTLGTTTVSLPSTTTLFAACLTTVGQFKDMVWGSVGTSTALAAGSGGTLNYSVATSTLPNKTSYLRIIRDASATYRAILLNAPN